jgi:hypothetical protein
MKMLKISLSHSCSHNSANYNLIPIVLGAHPDDYLRSSPPNSYIHTNNFSSPKHLANYLHQIDQNDTLYNSYFAWKGNGRFINTYFWCRVCASLHAHPKPSRSYTDISNWWNPKGICMARAGNWEKERSTSSASDINNSLMNDVIS